MPFQQTEGMADYSAIVVGAGHNGLVCAAYLARAGLRTLLIEARPSVGGTAASERFGGATVNICNCDHVVFRTTPIIDELGLADHGLRYLDVEPSQVNMSWTGGPAWRLFHDAEATLDELAATYPAELDGYRRYLDAAVPAVRVMLDAANHPPSPGGVLATLARHRGRGAATLLRWSRHSAADVVRLYFTAEALRGPALATGPLVWGLSPETPGTGLGALTYALRHVGVLGRPVGGSGAVPDSLAAAFTAAGGELRVGARAEAITCEGPAVRGVTLADGTELRAPVVVSACDPHDTFLEWLRDPPPAAEALLARWRSIPRGEGYESKIDAIVGEVPRLRALDRLDDPAAAMGATTVVAPSLADMHRGAQLIASGDVLERPCFLLNVPSIADPSVRAENGGHVLSLETLFTPYARPGGWPGSPEPRRWLERFSELVEPGFLGSVGAWRAMTPDRYERDFFLPHGHATSFAGGPLAVLVRRGQSELTSYRTPVRGLFLTGAATFPGAGVWGASGRNAATAILRAS
jgi:beta-carotene ketolase (CrtO type)